MLLIALVVLAAACERPATSPSGSEAESTLARITRTGAVSLGYANEAPYAYYDEKIGRLTGEAPEIARAVLKDMGIETIDGVLTEFGAMIPALKAGRFDLIAAGMYITPERCREIRFSNPTYRIGEAFLVKAGNPLGLSSYEDVATHPSATLGVVAGAVEHQYAQATHIPNDRIVVLPDAPSAVAAVQAGRVDAYAGTSLTIQHLLDKRAATDLERAQPFTDPVIDGHPIVGFGAFGFRKDDEEFAEEFNAHLARFVGSARHLELVRPFGFRETEVPGDVTAEQLCGA